VEMILSCGDFECRRVRFGADGKKVNCCNCKGRGDVPRLKWKGNFIACIISRACSLHYPKA
jgi:hypothetical protein